MPPLSIKDDESASVFEVKRVQEFKFPSILNFQTLRERRETPCAHKSRRDRMRVDRRELTRVTESAQESPAVGESIAENSRESPRVHESRLPKAHKSRRDRTRVDRRTLTRDSESARETPRFHESQRFHREDTRVAETARESIA